MLMSAPPASPYHHLARTAAHRWWRPVLGTVFIVGAGGFLAIAGFVIVTIAAEIAGRPEGADGVSSFGARTDLTLTFLTIAVLLPVTLLAARWIQRRPAGSLSSVAGRLRRRWLTTCLPVAFVAVVVFLTAGWGLAAATGVDAGLDDDLAGWRPLAVTTVILLLVVPLQSAAEEYFCRGWLLQGVGAWFRGPWVPIAVQASVFAALHGWGTPWGFADLLVFGVIAGWLTVRTGGLEAAIALHVMNNLIAMVIAAAYDDLALDETATDMPWQLAVVDLPVLLGYAAVVLWLARRRGIANRTPAAPVEPWVFEHAAVAAHRHPVTGAPGRTAAGQGAAYVTVIEV
jgi:membrane protease YdiL (CAAX protease family)